MTDKLTRRVSRVLVVAISVNIVDVVQVPSFLITHTESSSIIVVADDLNVAENLDSNAQ